MLPSSLRHSPQQEETQISTKFHNPSMGYSDVHQNLGKCHGHFCGICWLIYYLGSTIQVMQVYRLFFSHSIIYKYRPKQKNMCVS